MITPREEGALSLDQQAALAMASCGVVAPHSAGVCICVASEKIASSLATFADGTEHIFLSICTCIYPSAYACTCT